MSFSKYRNVFGEPKKEKFLDIDLCTTSAEGNLLAVNTNFLAVSWNSVGGCVAIFDANTPSRTNANIPLIRGHKSTVVDLKFSPFRSDLLATASDDSKVKFWEVPKELLKEDLKTELQTYSGHQKKVSFVQFNPVVSDVIASASFDNSVQVWNMLKAESLSNVKLKEYPTSCEWNYNGSLLCATSKDKSLYVIDPRQNKATINVHSHDSPKLQKSTFVSEHLRVTAGFSSSNVREMKLWDIRKAGEGEFKPVQKMDVDHQSGVMTPCFEKEHKLLFILGRGEGNIHYYDLNEGTIKPCNDYASSNPASAYALFETKCMDYNKCELVRFAKASDNYIEYLSFYYPKKNPQYDPNIYPFCYLGEPALTCEEWLSGQNKDPIVKEITEIENKWVSQVQEFEKKVEEPKAPQSEKEKIDLLESKVKELEDKVKELTLENDKLKEENNKLKEELNANKTE